MTNTEIDTSNNICCPESWDINISKYITELRNKKRRCHNLSLIHI